MVWREGKIVQTDVRPWIPWHAFAEDRIGCRGGAHDVNRRVEVGHGLGDILDGERLEEKAVIWKRSTRRRGWVEANSGTVGGKIIELYGVSRVETR